MEKRGAILYWRHGLCAAGAFVAEMEPRKHVSGGRLLLSAYWNAVANAAGDAGGDAGGTGRMHGDGGGAGQRSDHQSGAGPWGLGLQRSSL